MSKRRIFGPVFGGKNDPTPADVADIGIQLALLSGQRVGLQEKGQRAVAEQLGGAAQLADTVSERIGEAIYDEVGEAQTLAQGIVDKAHAKFVTEVLPATETAVRLGWSPAGAAGTGAGGKSTRRGKRGPRPGPAQEQPPSLTGAVGDAAGAPGAGGPPAPRADERSPLTAAASAADAAGSAAAAATQPAGSGSAGAPGSGPGAPQIIQGGPTGYLAVHLAPDGSSGTVTPVPPPGAPAAGGGATIPIGPANLAGGLPLPGGPLPAPAGGGGGFRSLLPLGPPQTAQGPGNGILTFLPFPPPGGPPHSPLYPSSGGPRVTLPLGGLGPVPVPPLGPPPALPGQPTGGGGGAGGTGPGGAGGGGDFGAPPGAGPVGPAGGAGGGGGTQPAPAPTVVYVQPTPVSLSCPAPVVTLQCPACGAVGQLPPVIAAPPAAPAAVPTVTPGGVLIESESYTGPAQTVNFSPLSSLIAELALGAPGASATATGGGGGGTAAGGGAAPGAAPVGEVVPTTPAGERAAEDIRRCLPGSEAIKQVAGKTVWEMLRDAGYIDDKGEPKWIVAAFEALKDRKDVWGDLARGAVNAGGFLQYWAFRAAEWVQQKAPSISGCPGPDVATAWVVSLVIGLVRHWIADIPDSLTYDWDTYCKWACPIAIPSQAEANSCYVHGTLTSAQWECLTRANGNDAKWQSRIVAADMDWITIDQIIGLERRGVEDQALLDRAWQRNGVGLNGDEQRLHRRAADWVPSPSDAVEWMGKDLADPLLTQTFGIFNEFRQKYTGDVKRALDYNGVPEEWARLIFGAHRKSVGPHTLYEMHKRLRPGWWASMPDADALHLAQAIAPRRPGGEGGLKEQASALEFLAQQRSANALYGSDPGAVARFGPRVWAKAVKSPDPKIVVPADLSGLPPLWLDEIGDNPESARAFLAETVTSGFHVFEGLSQANYPPFWRARLIALSYNVLTRVDIRRAYETGQLTQAAVGEKLQDRGYTPVDAGTLAGQWHEAAVQLHTRRPAANMWVKTGYSISLLQQALQDQGMRADMWPDVLRRLQVRRKLELEVRCLAHLKKQLVAGLVEDSAVLQRLAAVGLTVEEAQRVRAEWACEMRAIPKYESAAQVCKYLHQQLIGPEHAVRLVHRAGYTYPQARRIVNSCLLTPPRKGQKKREALDAALKEAARLAPPEEQEITAEELDEDEADEE